MPSVTRFRAWLLLAGSLAACSGGSDDDGTTTPDALELVTTAIASGEFGKAYDEKIAARGGVPPYTFRHVEGDLPGGLMLKAETGQLSGVFTEAGTFTFTIEVSDTADTKASRELSIAVTAEPLLISTATLPDGDTATAYSARLEATGGVRPLTWATTAGALPQGLTLDGEGLVSGMPTEAGTFTVTIEVTDADGTTDDRELTFEIEDASPMITSMLLPPARAGGPYNAQIEVTGGTSPYTFTLVAGTLPNGLSMDGAGAITGLPDDDGSFTFTVEVTDANDLTDSLQLMILAVQEFTITTSALPLGLLGDAYDADLEATGGVPPYRWVLVNDTPLPAGLTLSDAGKISGTPTEGGDFFIRVRAIDEGGTGIRSSRAYTLRVRDLRQYSAATSGVTFPPLCTTSTHVSYQTVEVEVPDSFAIADVNVTLDIAFTDTKAGGARLNEKLRVFLVSPSGRQLVVCGNGAAIPGGVDCPNDPTTSGPGLASTFGTLGATPPSQPVDVLVGTNAQGTWRLRVGVVEPSTTGGNCDQAGMIDDVTLTLAADNSPDPYIRVTGFTTNNLLAYPWVRISGGGIAAQQQLFLAATLWDVGANGRREAGGGDDVPDPRAFTWTGAGLPTGTAITPDGHVTTGGITSRGMMPTVTASDGMGNDITLPIAITPPDWNPDVREF